MLNRAATMTRCRLSSAAIYCQTQPRRPHFLSNHLKPNSESQPKMFTDGKVPGSGMHWLYYLNKRYDNAIPIKAAAPDVPFKVKLARALADEEKLVDFDLGFLETFVVPIALYVLLDPLVKPLT